MDTPRSTDVGTLRALGIMTRVQIGSGLMALPGKSGLASGAGRIVAYVVYALLGAFLSLCVGVMVLAIDPSLIPGAAVIFAAAIAVVLTFQNASGSLFGFRDYDQVMALPVPTWVIVLSRVGVLFAAQVVVSAILMLPMYAVYALVGDIGVAQIAVAVVSVVLSSALPVSVAVALSFGIALVAARSRNFNAVYLVLSVLLSVAVLVGSFSLQQTSSVDTDAIFAFLSCAIALYPPAAWVGAAWDGNLVCLVPFCLLSLGAIAVCIAVLARCFMVVNAAVTVHGRGRSVGIDAVAQKRAGALRAMVKKELRCIFGTPIYAMNSIGGSVFIAVVAAMLLMMGSQGAVGAAFQYMNVDASAAVLTRQLSDAVLPWVFVFCMSAASSACAAVSMEGPAAWTMATAPVPRRVILGSKVLASAVHTVPVLALALAVLAVTGSITPLVAVVSFLLGCAAHAFVACLGLMLDAAHPHYSWTKPADVVKRGRPIAVVACLSLAFSFGGAAATIAALLFAGEPASYACMLLFAAVFALFARVCFWRAQKASLFIG